MVMCIQAKKRDKSIPKLTIYIEVCLALFQWNENPSLSINIQFTIFKASDVEVDRYQMVVCSTLEQAFLKTHPSLSLSGTPHITENLDP